MQLPMNQPTTKSYTTTLCIITVLWRGHHVWSRYLCITSCFLITFATLISIPMWMPHEIPYSACHTCMPENICLAILKLLTALIASISLCCQKWHQSHSCLRNSSSVPYAWVFSLIQCLLHVGTIFVWDVLESTGTPSKTTSVRCVKRNSMRDLSLKSTQPLEKWWTTLRRHRVKSNLKCLVISALDWEAQLWNPALCAWFPIARLISNLTKESPC